MVWKVRRVDEFDTTDVVSPTDFATAADAMDVSLDDAVVRLKAYLTTSPTEDIGADVRAYRRVIRNDLMYIPYPWTGFPGPSALLKHHLGQPVLADPFHFRRGCSLGLHPQRSENAEQENQRQKHRTS